MWKSIRLQGFPSPDVHPLWDQSCRIMLQAVLHSPPCLRTLSSMSHVLSVNLLTSVKGAGTRVGPACSGVLWWMLVDLHGARLWPQFPLKDTEPSRQAQDSVSYSLIRNMQMGNLLEVIFVGLWQCSFCSFFTKEQKPFLVRVLGIWESTPSIPSHATHSNKDMSIYKWMFRGSLFQIYFTGFTLCHMFYMFVYMI